MKSLNRQAKTLKQSGFLDGDNPYIGFWANLKSVDYPMDGLADG